GAGMGGELGEADVARMRRMGVEPLATEQGLELFDSAVATGEPQLLPVQLDIGPLRAHARAGTLPPILRGLVRAPAERTRDAGGSLARRLAGVPESERARVVRGLVRAQ